MASQAPAQTAHVSLSLSASDTYEPGSEKFLPQSSLCAFSAVLCNSADSVDGTQTSQFVDGRGQEGDKQDSDACMPLPRDSHIEEQVLPQ